MTTIKSIISFEGKVGKVALIVLLIISWLSLSTYWYVCEIGNLCESEETVTRVSAPAVKTEQTDQDIEGEVPKDKKIEETSEKISTEEAVLFESSSIYFQPDSDQPTEAISNQTTIEAAVQIAKENQSSRVILVGYTANLDSDTAGDFVQLATDRAQTVRASFLAAEIDESRISVSAKGASGGTLSPEENRRVTIEIKQGA